MHGTMNIKFKKFFFSRELQDRICSLSDLVFNGYW